MRILKNHPFRAIGITIGCLLAFSTANGQASASGQPAPTRRGPLAEDVFKNIQVLRGTTVSEFMATMGFFSASLGLNCVDCHVNGSLTHWEKFAEDVPRKRVARTMVAMVNNINKANFGGQQVVTCYTCHRGEMPKAIPSLTLQYEVPTEDPDTAEIVTDPPPGPSADEILNKYIEALGGAQRLASLTSFVGKGTYEGYDSYQQKVAFEVFAKAPDQRTTIVHTQNGENKTVFDGHEGWVATIDKSPVPLLPLNPGGELDGARLDADLCFPSRFKTALSRWRVGFPFTTIDDKPVQIVEGTGSSGTRVKLYFDAESGLLTRLLRYTKTIVGFVPTQVDYSDYREVNGIKMPFHWVVTWTDGRSTIELSDVQPNVSINSAIFAQPAPAVVTSKKAPQ